jgi:hypothetical protein
MADGREKQRVVAAAAEAAAAAVLLLLLSSMTTKMREPSFKLSPSSFLGFLVTSSQVKSSQVKSSLVNSTGKTRHREDLGCGLAVNVHTWRTPTASYQKNSSNRHV